MLTITRVVIFAGLISSVTIPFSAYADTLTGASGGSGGAPFKQPCRSGYILRGIGAKVGSWIDGVIPVCTKAFGNLAGLSQPDGLAWFGGDGGENVNTLCSKGEAVYEMSATSGMLTDQIRGLTKISFRCSGPNFGRSPLTDLRSPTTPIGGAEKPKTIVDTLTCPPGLIATGIYGRWGKWLDQIGLICDRVSPP